MEEKLLEQSQKLFKTGKYEEAVSCVETILQKSNYMNCDALYIQAMCYMHLGQFDKAWACIHKSKTIDENYIGAYMAEIYIHKKQGRLLTEVKLLQKIILHIKKMQEWKNSGCYGASLSEAWSLLGSAYTMQGKPRLAMEAFLTASHLEKDKMQRIKEYSNALFVTNYMSDITAVEMKKLHQGFQSFFDDTVYFPHFLEKKMCLRIGYISPDFRRHPVASFITPLLEKYNKEKFQIYCYVAGPSDEVTLKLQKMGGVWKNICNLGPAAAAQLIYEDKIDILVDLSGHTKGSCLSVLAYKPAPVQLTGIGYFNTTGLMAVDYVLTDVFCDPEDKATDEFTEELICLPHSHFCYAPLEVMPAKTYSPVMENGFITFGCFNNFNKVTDQILFLWAEILRDIPNSRLLLKSKIFDSDEGVALIQGRLLQAGFSLKSVELRGFTADYLEQYSDVDIALDTFPYTGGATTCEALYMGVPVVTLCGERHGSRFGYSLLKNAGLSELIAASTKEYIEKAKTLANDLELLSGLHQNLRHMVETSDLMNQLQYIDSIENAYQSIWGGKLIEQAEIKIERNEFGNMRLRLLECISNCDYRQAEVLVRILLQEEPSNKELLGILIGIYIETNEAEKASIPMKRMKQLYPEDVYGRFLNARINYLENKWMTVIKQAEEALQQCPEPTNQMKSMLYNLLGAAYKDSGEAQKSTACYLQASYYSETLMEKAAEYSNYLFNLHYLPEISASEMYTAHEKYNEFFMDVLPYNHQLRQRGKIKIGYISPDFRQHVVTFFSYALFKNYDRALFEVKCYAKCTEDAVSQQIKSQVDDWKNIQGLKPEAIAAMIFSDGIDILVDLSGHTRNNCLPIMAYKPAPVQICGIGYFNTTGLKSMDYFIGDIYTDKAEENEDIFSEKILRLPHSHFCYVPPDTMPSCGDVPCKKNGYITFGSFNNFTKTTDEMLTVWKEILDQVADSHLLLKSKIFSSQEGCIKVEKRLKKVGISLDRVEMRSESSQYLQEYGDVDIALDTYPYPGGGTTCDALYMGVPIITLVGKRHGSRFGYSILKNLGISDCCAFSKEEYIKSAVRLAKDKRKLIALHRNLRDKMHASSLMDGALYMQDLEKEYIRVSRPFWQKNKDEPGDMENFLQKAQGLFVGKQWDRLIQLIRKVNMEIKDCPEIFYLLSRAYLKKGDYHRGIQIAEEILKEGYYQNNPEFLAHLGAAHKELLQYLDAENYFAMAISCLEKQQQGNQGKLLATVKVARGQLLVLLGKTPMGAELYRQASEKHPLLADRNTIYGSYLLSLHYQKQQGIWLYNEHCHYNDFFLDIVPYKHQYKKMHEKIRIGYVSPDFRQHVMFYFYHVLLTKYDKQKFEVYCYSLAKNEDAFSAYLKPFVTSWMNGSGMTDKVLAQNIYTDEIDILVDLAGHSAGSGLSVFAYKPAPIQVSGLGYVNTTGLSSVDYFITDENVDPLASNDQYFSEKLLRLSQSQFCYTGRSDVPIPTDAPCNKNGYVTFGCFNNFSKITDTMLELWLKIMNEVEESQLVLKSQVFVSEQAIEAAKKRFNSLGYDLNRVLFSPATDDYMVQYMGIDIALDTYPYPGGGTTCDALYMGVPVISLYGSSHGTRFGYSILKSIGMEELAVQTEIAYAQKAIALAKDRELLDLLHKNLRQMMLTSVLMDEKIYMNDLEELYIKIHDVK